jgi:hypothetical protein
MRFSNVMDSDEYRHFPTFDVDSSFRKWNLWGYVDARVFPLGHMTPEETAAWTEAIGKED